MTQSLRALRGATTLDVDTEEQVHERVGVLLREMLDRNQVGHDDLVSIVFTATPDLHAVFPAEAARGIGISDVPLLCATEINVPGAMPRVLRLLAHVTTPRSRAEIHHVYLRGAKALRTDLPQ